MTDQKPIADLARRWEKLATAKRQFDRDRAKTVILEHGASFARAYLDALAVVEAAREACMTGVVADLWDAVKIFDAAHDAHALGQPAGRDAPEGGE